MNCEDRLEQLLGQAGQTISDLPKNYPYGQIGDAFNTAHIWNGWRGKASAYGAYILHLTDIIDRMEWALDNAIRERDWLRRMCERSMTPCDLCRYGERQMDVQPCASCTTFDTGDQYEFGLPEDTKAEEDGDGLG